MNHAYSTIRIRMKQPMLLSFSPIIMVNPNNDFVTRSFSASSWLAIHRPLSRTSITMLLTIDDQCGEQYRRSQSNRMSPSSESFFSSDEDVSFSLVVSFQEDLLWAVMEPLTAATVKLFDGFEFPKQGMKFEGVRWNTEGYLWRLILFPGCSLSFRSSQYDNKQNSQRGTLSSVWKEFIDASTGRNSV